MWPGVAQDLRSLAPRLAPRNLVSGANVRMSRAQRRPRHVSPVSGPTWLRRIAPTPHDGSIRHGKEAAHAGRVTAESRSAVSLATQPTTAQRNDPTARALQNSLSRPR